MNMDAVKAFNNELLGLYEVKPPISKAKMTSITRTAIKAIKFYKHVVQSVEKFILKCKPDYKVPGLYVIDAIVRQSRNQFGADKDVFAPRFAKNMSLTFSNLFSCPPEEKGKIIRVLNLWQKNQVFTPDVIQPLFDQLTDPNNPIHRETTVPSNGMSVVEKTPPHKSGKFKFYSAKLYNYSIGGQILPTSRTKSPGDAAPSRVKIQLDAANKALQELSGVAAMFTSQQKSPIGMGVEFMQQWQHLQNLLSTVSPQKQERSDAVMFDKKILDFDYGDEDDENTSPHAANASNEQPLNNILQNPEVLRSLSMLKQLMSQAQGKQQHLDEEKMRKLREMKQQEEEFDKHLAQTVPKLPFASECDLMAIADIGMTSGLGKHDMAVDDNNSDVECLGEGKNTGLMSMEGSLASPGDGSRLTTSPPRHRRRRSRSRSRSRSQKRRRHRSRSRSRQRHRDRDRERDKERDAEVAKEKERRKKGLPPIKKNHLSVCSTTLWIGHLSKLVQQESMSDTFGQYGLIVSIDLIPPRGCGFVCMNRRQDAARALIRLQNHKIHGKTITLAWAPGKGVKGREFKDYWEVSMGVSYIPWSCLTPNTNFAELEEGGAIDEESMPEHLRPIIIDQLKKHRGEKDHFITPNVMNPLAAAGFLPTGAEVLATPMAVIPGMNLPPPGLQNAPGAPTIDTSQPPPNISGAKMGLQQMAVKPGMVLPPPFPFANLPPPMGLNMSSMMGNMPMGVPPPLSGLMMPQPLMHPGLMPQMGLQEDTSNKDLDKGGDNMDIDNDDPKKFRDNRDWNRSRDVDERRNSRDDRKDRDRRDRGDRGRDRHRDRRDRGGRSRNRSRSREPETRNRSREHRNRERPKDGAPEKREDGEEKKGPLTSWVEVPPAANTNQEKPSLLQRLRSIAEGGSIGLAPAGPHDPPFVPPMDERQGPPIVNLNNSGPRSLFGSRGPDPFTLGGPPLFNDNRRVRPPFNGPGPGFDDMGPGPGPDDGPLFHSEMMFEGDGPMFDRRPNRGRFDGPRPLMGAPFDDPPADMMLGVPPMFMDDFPHPGGGGPRMRFGPPRGRGGPGFAPRGPRPLMSRPMAPWMDNQPNDRPRPPFEDRVSRERRNSGRRRDRDGPRASRWSREENKDENSEVVSETQEETQDTQSAPAPANRDTQTPVFDEQPPAAPAELKPDFSEPNEEQKSDEVKGNSTPCHDEPSEETVQEVTE